MRCRNRDTGDRMPEENVEIIRDFHDEYRRGDLEAIYARYHPAVEVRSWMGSLWEGRDAVMEAMREWLRQWEWFSAEVEEIIGLDGDRAIVINRFRGKGRLSGAETEWTAAEIWTFRDGKIAAVIDYPNVADALEAAGVHDQQL
jgi:ketosteroid isomerase-like protein